MEKINRAITQAGLQGSWKQGGQLLRGVFEGFSASGPFIINFHAGTLNAGTVWVQGKAANTVHVQINAAREGWGA